MWMPKLANGPEPIYERLVAALERDVASGTLVPGTRLPPHRELAHRLKLGVGTVTRAYAEAESRGLIAAHVGRGSFVAEKALARPLSGAAGVQGIDLARNTPPFGPAARRLADALGKLRHRPDLVEHLHYAPPEGFEAHRRAGAAWLARTANFADLDWRRVVCCGGAQQGMTLALSTICRPGDTVMTESATFFGFKSLAEHAGYRLRGLAMDEEGLRPDAIERAAAEGARVLYTVPTLQNPTGRIMSLARRREVADVARRHAIWIIEDDIYAPYAVEKGLPPLASLAPELTFYVSGISKMLAPGLRTGYLLPPAGRLYDEVLQHVRAFNYAPPSFGSLIATQWIEDGTADAIAQEIRHDVRARTQLAETILADAIETPRAPQSLHVWLPMSELDAERVARRTLRDGVRVTPPSAPMVGDAAETGVRICLGGVADPGMLEKALLTVRAALSGETDAGTGDII